MRDKITLNNPERFAKPYSISKEKLTAAVSEAADRLEKMGREHDMEFPGSWPKNYKYVYGPSKNWICGMYTGCFWLAYQLTGEKFFKEKAEKLTRDFRRRFDEKIGMDDHDVGFNFSPSCVAAYNITGDEAARTLALEAADYLYEHSYSKEGKFIIRAWKNWDAGTGCRTMMDSLMNAPLLFWATEQTGDKKYRDAAIEHIKTTEKLLIRRDSSSYHHYQFDPKTAAPVGGITCQGRSDESCWSRGQSWGVYGLAIANAYNPAPFIANLQRDLTYYFLNHLPEDLIPCWDFDFVSNKAIKDSSAGIVTVCGLDEMAKALPESSEKVIYESAAAQMLEAVIDNCTGELGIDYDGLIFHVTAALPQGAGIDEIAVYGDYFYLEALARKLIPNFKRCW